MGRGAGDDFEHAGFSQLPKRGQQIAFPLLDKEAPTFRKHFEIEFGELVKLRLIPAALDFASCEIEQKIDMSHVTLAQKVVLQHRAKRRRDGHGEPERDGVAHQPLHHGQQRNISFGDRLEQPIFFEKMFVLGMPNERQMRVQHEREKTRSHCGLRRDYDCALSLSAIRSRRSAIVRASGKNPGSDPTLF